MAIETSFTIKQVNVDEALKQAENKAKKTAGKIDNHLNKSGNANQMTKSLNAGLKSANSLGAKLGGTLKNVLGGLVSGGLWGAAIGAVIMGFQKIYDLWQDMTLSIEEKIQLASDKLSNASKEFSQAQGEVAEQQNIVKTLKDLDKMKNKSEAVNSLMIELVNMLNEKYGYLGQSINQTTGELQNFEKVIERVRQRQIDKLLEKKADEVSQAQKLVNMRSQDANYYANLDGSQEGLKGLDKMLDQTAKNPKQYAKIKALRDAYADLLGKQKQFDTMTRHAGTLANIPLQNKLNALLAQNKQLEKQIQDMDRESEFSRRAGNGPDRELNILKQRLAYVRQLKISQMKKGDEYAVQLNKANDELKPLRETQKHRQFTNEEQRQFDDLTKKQLELNIKLSQSKKQQLKHRLTEKQIAQQISQLDQKRTLKILSTKQTLQDELKQMRNALANSKQSQFEYQKQKLKKQGVLTPQTEKLLKRNIELKFNMQDLEKLKPNLSNLDIRTNELTARGGFQTGAVTADLGVINSQIRDYAAMQVRLLQRMDSKLNTNGGGY